MKKFKSQFSKPINKYKSLDGFLFVSSCRGRKYLLCFSQFLIIFYLIQYKENSFPVVKEIEASPYNYTMEATGIWEE